MTFTQKLYENGLFDINELGKVYEAIYHTGRETYKHIYRNTDEQNAEILSTIAEEICEFADECRYERAVDYIYILAKGVATDSAVPMLMVLNFSSLDDETAEAFVEGFIFEYEEILYGFREEVMKNERRSYCNL